MKPNKQNLVVACLTLVFVALAASVAVAHDSGLSATEVKLAGDEIIARVIWASSDLDVLVEIDLDDDGRISKEEFTVARDALQSLAQASLELTVDGQLIESSRGEALIDDAGEICLQAAYSYSSGSRLVIRSLLLDRLAPGHRQFFSVRDQSEAIVTERLLDSRNNSLDIQISRATKSPALICDFVLLGVEHILTGYDHIAFLFGLLIVGTTLKEAAAIITSFTVAHSVTLALSALEIFSVSTAVVEPLIATSIVYVGVENLRRRELRRRWLVTFAFGLVHGFGFASVLQELQIGTGATAIVSLFSFNSGVEIGQMAIAAAVLPVIRRLRKRERFADLLVPSCSIVIVLFGSYWLIQRLQG